MGTEHSAATNPRRMIYGVLGLFEDEVVALIKPDYSLLVAHIYVEYARAIITAHKNLSIIYQYGKVIGHRGCQTLEAWTNGRDLGLSVKRVCQPVAGLPRHCFPTMEIH